MARRRVFLTGSERAEFEHIYGPVPIDDTDPRFALLTEEEEALVRALPAGVPIRAQSQDAASVAKIQAHFEKAGGFEGGSTIPADKSAVDVEPVERKDAAPAEGGASPAEPAEPVGRGASASEATKADTSSDSKSDTKSKSKSK